MGATESERVMNRPGPAVARTLAGRLDALFAQDAALVRQLNQAQQRLQAANDRLWWGLHPDGLAAVYGEHPAAVDVAFAEHRIRQLRRLGGDDQVVLQGAADDHPIPKCDVHAEEFPR